MAVPLPIDAHLPAICDRLRRGNLVLVAEPGAGKTTRVPAALLERNVVASQIWVAEPRRIAARMAARRVAAEMGEAVGGRVGYQVRFDEKAGPETRLRFVTDGILRRRLLSADGVDGIGIVILDEFHERRLDTDVVLALLRRRQAEHAGPRIAVMSATLDAAPVADYLACEVMRVEGRRFPVSIEFDRAPDTRPLEQRVATAARRVVSDAPSGDLLVFLPGAAEIRRSTKSCEALARDAGFDLVRLHGDLPPDEQERAIRPGARRKVILSTNVAESSITIEGVVAVVDSGLAKVSRHSPWTGLSSLDVLPVSRASAEQRAGRAGRLRPGRCVRLYTQHDHDSRPERDAPEILRADLSEVTLALGAAGAGAIEDLPWFQSPDAKAIAAARAVLERLQAVSSGGEMTSLGGRMARLPVHPRLARLILAAAERGLVAQGCTLAAILGERDLRQAARFGGDDRSAGVQAGPSDLLALLDLFELARDSRFDPERLREAGLVAGAVRAVARAGDQLRRHAPLSAGASQDPDRDLMIATLAAFPDRVGKRRRRGSGDVVFAEGGAGTLAPQSVVRDAELLVAVDATTARGQVMIRLASAIEADWLIDLFPEQLTDRTEVRFLPDAERVEAVDTLRYGAIVLDESRVPGNPEEVARVLAEAALAAGPETFCDPRELHALVARVAFAAPFVPELAPIDEAEVREALAELCVGRRSFSELRDASLVRALLGRIAPRIQARFREVAPERISLPSGRRPKVHYEMGRPPWIASRLQDFFGMRDGPRIGLGKVPLVLHLLAPNQRPVQVTTDLEGFWTRHYATLRRQLMRRYPKHAWPETP